MSVPALRFPEFEGEWEDTKAGNGFANSRAKGEAGLPIYSVTMDRGLVRRDSLDRHMHGDAADETNLRAQSGDIVYNMMRMWQGAAGIAPEECMVSPAYVVLSPKEETSSEFFNYRIENARMLYQLWAYSHGLTSDRLRLYFADFARIPVSQPTLPEQKKIAAFLGVVDDKLSALKSKRDLLGEYKRGLMQKLFSQELRFAKPNGQPFPDWEEKRLGDVFTERSERDNENAELLSVTMSSGVVRAKDVGRVDGASKDKSNYKSVYQNDIAYNSMRMWQGANGVSAYDGIVSPAYTVITPRLGQIPDFWGYSFKLKKVIQEFQRHSQGLTSDTWNLKFPALSSIKLQIPHPDEQQKIADALSALDDKISAVADQITAMQDFKKGLLQQMFV